MKRILLLTIGLLTAATTFGAPVAQADFHNRCPSGAGATVGLSAAAGTLTFTGSVKCIGADSVTISSLSLTSVVPPGTTAGGTNSCTNCTTTVTATGSLSGAPAGVYEVRMQFTVLEAGFGPATAKKLGRWVYNGASLTKVCPGGNAESCAA